MLYVLFFLTNQIVPAQHNFNIGTGYDAFSFKNLYINVDSTHPLTKIIFSDTSYLIDFDNLKVKLIPPEEDSISEWRFSGFVDSNYIWHPNPVKIWSHYLTCPKLELEVNHKKYLIELKEEK